MLTGRNPGGLYRDCIPAKRRGKKPAYRIFLYGILGSLSIALAFRLPPHALAGSAPLSEAAFWEKLQQTRNLGESLRTAPEAEICASFKEEAQSWADIREVQLASGTVIPVRADWLIAGLRKCPPEIDLLLDRIDALQDAVENRRIGESPSGFDPGPLRKILSQKEFTAYTDSAPKEDPLQALWNSFLEWINKTAAGTQIPLVFIWIGGIFATAILLAVLWLAFRMFRRNIAQQIDAGPADTPAPGFLTSEQALELGRKKSLAGNPRVAIRYLYLSALLFLEEQGYLSYNRSLTNQEYVRSIAHLPHLAAPLQRIVNIFDRVWYGFQIPSEDEYRDYLDLVNGIRRSS